MIKKNRFSRNLTVGFSWKALINSPNMTSWILKKEEGRERENCFMTENPDILSPSCYQTNQNNNLNIIIFQNIKK